MLTPNAPGDESLSRISIAATMILCVVLCQFVYVNNFAVPDYEDITWKSNFTILPELPVPAVALFRVEQVLDSANLISNDNNIMRCRQSGNDQCGSFQQLASFDLEDGRSAQYEIFDPTGEGFVLRPRQFVSLYYQYDYNGNVTIDPHVGFVVFDPKFIDNFRQAYRCGFVSVHRFPTHSQADVSVELVSIQDQQHAAPEGMKKDCKALRRGRFQRYTTWQTMVTPLHQADFANNSATSACDRRLGRVEPCWGNITLWPASMTNTSYTSLRKYDFRQALIDEGGIVGFVQFFAYFLTIWK